MGGGGGCLNWMAGRYCRLQRGRRREWVGLAEQLSQNRAAAWSAVKLAGATLVPPDSCPRGTARSTRAGAEGWGRHQR